MSMKNTRNAFNRDDSLSLKGIAIIMLLFHHTFRVSRYYEGYVISFYPFIEHQINNLTESFKICVAIFAFISGYGLFLNYSKNIETNSTSIWCIRRYIKSFSGYWFAWILVAGICQIINFRTTAILLKDGRYNGIIYGIIDLFGLSKLFDTPSLNGTWWYMSVTFSLILLTPLLYKFRDNLIYVLFFYILFLRLIFGKNGSEMYPGNNAIYPFLISFIFGSIFARYDLFTRWIKIGSNAKVTKIYKCIAEGWIVILGYKFYHNIPRDKFWEYHYGIYTVIVILFCVEFVITIPVFNHILAFLGKHSMNMFLTHSILQVYLNDFFYSRQHFLITILILIGFSITLSVIIEALKHIIRYDNFVNWLLSRVDMYS